MRVGIRACNVQPPVAPRKAYVCFVLDMFRGLFLPCGLSLVVGSGEQSELLVGENKSLCVM